MSSVGLRSCAGSGVEVVVAAIVVVAVISVIENPDANDATGETASVSTGTILLGLVVPMNSDELAIRVGESEDMIEDAELDSDAMKPCEECSDGVRGSSISAAAASIFLPSA